MAEAASELVVFDLDGTLLNAQSEISPFTRDTLAALRARGIPYTVATGRARHGAEDLLTGLGFDLPQAFKNGVLLWHPMEALYSHHHHLRLDEIRSVLEAAQREGLSPFIATLEAGNTHRIYHAPELNETEQALAKAFRERDQVDLADLAQLPGNAEITSISALGPQDAVERLAAAVAPYPELVAYAGDAFEGPGLGWIDIHHGAGTKGSAVEALKALLNVDRLVVFGDGSNDLSMFAVADEAYAPENARAEVRRAATETIGHHDADGVAHFLHERFKL